MGGVSCSETLADRSPVTAKAVHSENSGNQVDYQALIAEKDALIQKLELAVSKMENSCKDDYDDDDDDESELKGGERYRMTAEESRRWWEDAKSSVFNLRYWNALLRTVWSVDYPRVLRQFALVTKNSKAVNAVDRKAHASYKHVFGCRVLLSNKEISYPITALDAEGAYFWDVDGNKYLDCCCSWGAVFYGHKDPYVDGAIKAAIDSGYQTALHASDSGEAATLLCELTGNDRVGFQSSGSEACMCAIKVARAYTCKNKILTFNLHYHGWFDPFLHHNVSKKLKDHLTGEEGKGQDHIRNYFNTLPEGSSAPIYTGIPDDTDVLVLDLDEAVGDFIRRHKDELACVILEPVTGKTALPKPHLLKMLREACTETGVVLIFDEVFIGFRCHVGGAQKYFGIQADMCTYGKVIGGGFGIGAVAGKAKIMEYLDGGAWTFGDSSLPAANRTYIGGTHAGHPVVMSACAAIMRRFKERGNRDHEILNDRVNQVSNELRSFLDQDKRLNPLVNNFGSFLCFYNNSFRIDEMKQTFEHVMVLRGMYFPTALGMLRLLFSTQHKEAEMRMLVDVFKQTYKDMFATVGAPWCLERPKVLLDDARVEIADAYMKRRGIKPSNPEIPNPIPKLAYVEPEYVGTYVEETRNLIRTLVPAKSVTTVQAAFKQPILSGSWTTILLTGATGFVGRHVLQQILTTTNYKVIAIVRELNGVESQARLDEALSQAGIELSDEQKSRLRVVTGDLEQEHFGIGADRSKELARQVEAVFNCASYTGPGNWQEGKKTLHIAVNLAKFCYPLIWLVHYSSFVQDFRYNDRFSRVAGALYYFTYVLDPKDISQEDGYSMGKWAADELISVVDHFTPCIVVRIGQPWVSKTGYIDPKSYYARFFQACAKTESIPSDQHLFEVSPVDSVAEVSVKMVIEEASKPLTSTVVFVTADSPIMYVCQMEGIKNKHVKEIAKKNGITLKSVPYDSWKQKAKSAVPWDKGFDDYVDRQHHMFRKKVQWRNKYLPIIQYPFETPGFPDPKEAFDAGIRRLKANGFL